MKMETRIYLIPAWEIKGGKTWKSLTAKQKIKIAEEHGLVYSLEGFEKAINSDNYLVSLDTHFIYISNK